MPSSFISEKDINGTVYQAYRDDENPRIVYVFKDGEPCEYQGDFKTFWLTLK